MMSDLTLVQRAEWDFSTVPEKEVWACMYYEYARENSRENLNLCRDLTVWLRFFPHGCKWPKDWGEISLRSFPDGFKCPIDWDKIPDERNDWSESEKKAILRFYDSLAIIAAASPTFPSIPWMQIPRCERQRLLERIDWPAIEGRLKRRKNSPRDLSFYYPRSFEINDWEFNDNELVERFRKWLKTTRPIRLNKRGRLDSPVDLLNHLSSLRLSRLSEEDRALAFKGKTIDPSNFNRAVNIAKLFSQRFYNSQKLEK